LAELFWLQSQVSLLRKDPETADQLLQHAERAIEKSDSPVPSMHVICHRLLLRDTFPGNYSENVVQLRVRLNQVCEQLDDSSMYHAPFVTQLAVFLLKEEFPKTTARLEQFISPGFTPTSDLLTSENLRGLEEYRESWELADGPTLEAAA
jgi:hypothetical protein